MKAGTTTLFRRLETVPGIELPATKEPHYFSRDERYSRGLVHYSSIFPKGQALTGEASVGYSDPSVARRVSDRMMRDIPGVKLIFVARDPVARARSHYIHEVSKGRERRRFHVALTAPDCVYLRRSEYARALGPYLELFDRSEVFVMTSENLDDLIVWKELLDFIGAPHSPMPAEKFNVGRKEGRQTATFRWLATHNLDQPFKKLPQSLRSHLKRRMVRQDIDYDALIHSGLNDELTPGQLTMLRGDASQFSELVGWDGIPWSSLQT